MTLALWKALLFVAACASGALALLVSRDSLVRKVCVVATAIFSAMLLVAVWPVDPIEPEAPPIRSRSDAVVRAASLPEPSIDQGYVSSNACKDCHADEYGSWHRTYHRTMTQAATPESVIPSFDNVTLKSRGRTYHLERRGSEFWVDMIDPAVELRAFLNQVDLRDQPNAPRKQMQIVMTTGSHLHQTYWAQSPSGTFIQVPWVYHIKQNRWVFRTDSFLAPPHDSVFFNYWNTSCIACHSTGGQPRITSRTMHSSGEMGIACEACHGPGARHVREQQLARHGVAGITSPADCTDVVNPKRLTAERSANVCGQCHIIAERKDAAAWLARGDPYRPGQDNFHANRVLSTPRDDVHESVLTAAGMRESTRFWPDGAVRAGGREYNGLVDSPCFQKGEGERKLTCISCHSMHAADPNKLVTPGMETNHACTQCHKQSRFNEQLATHTHHAADSSGSLCYNCHMPHTSYALFHAARSHRVDSPQAIKTTDGMRPNACNLCHLDKPVAWTASQLSSWYGTERADLSRDDQQVSAAVLWALRGDASQRVLAAWHLGWQAAREASGTDWPPRYLAELLNDPYGAVRYVAYESLRQCSGYEHLEFDFDAAESEREAAREAVLDMWRKSIGADSLRNRSALLLDDPQRVRALKSERDDRPITVLE